MMCPLPAWRSAIALFSAAALGCSGLEVAEDDGTTRLSSLPTIPVQEEVRIGSVDDPDVGFTRIFGVDIGDDGLVYLFEGQAMEFRVYEADGTFVRRFGRRGQGPGEFEMGARFGLVGDTVWAIESFNGRVTLFDRLGTVLETGRVEGLAIPVWGGGWGYVRPQVMRGDGLFAGYLNLIGSSRGNPPPSVDGSARIRVPRVLFDISGEVVDTAGWDESPPPRMARPPSQETEYRTVEVGGRRLSVPTPGSELPDWMHLVDGRIVLEAPFPASLAETSFTVTRIGLASDTVYHRRLLYEPAPYPDWELDSIAARGARGPMFFPPRPVEEADPAAVSAVRDAISFPPGRPAVTYGLVDDDERVWLLRNEPDGPTSNWIVLDADGSALGQVQLPGGARHMWAGGDVLWAVETDDFDIPWLVRYRLGRAP